MKKYTPITIGLIVILFGVFVWPTVYQYDKMNGKWPVRINRITGETEVLYQNGWQSLNQQQNNGNEIFKQSEKVKSNIKSIDLGEIELINISYYPNNDDIAFEIHNKSNRPITVNSLNFTCYGSSGNITKDQPSYVTMGSLVSLHPNESHSFRYYSSSYGKPEFIDSFSVKTTYVFN